MYSSEIQQSQNCLFTKMNKVGKILQRKIERCKLLISEMKKRGSL